MPGIDHFNMTRRHSTRLDGTVTVALLALMVLALPAPASASEGEASIFTGPVFANANDASQSGPQFGIGGQLGIVFGITDFWALDLGAEGVYHPPATPGDIELSSMVVQNAFAGFRYNLDVFVYVPYVGLSALAYTRAPRLSPKGSQRPAVGTKLTVGVDWRFQRHWSLGGLAELHAINFDFGSFPSYSSIMLKLGYHFRL